jgi:hypothetical protein
MHGHQWLANQPHGHWKAHRLEYTKIFKTMPLKGKIVRCGLGSDTFIRRETKGGDE